MVWYSSKMVKVYCEYCDSLAKVFIRFQNPYICKNKEVMVIHVCALHATHVILNEKYNVCDMGGCNTSI